MSLVVQAERKLDYLSFTLAKVNSPYEVYPMIGLQFEERGYGLHRYKNSAGAVAGGAMVPLGWVRPWHGSPRPNLRRRARLIEAQDGFLGWRAWIGMWLDRGAKVARFDMAMISEVA
jgi:hypothetical protein